MRLAGDRVTLRIAEAGDIAPLAAIRSSPEVLARWPGDDPARDITAAIVGGEVVVYAIEYRGEVIGALEWYAEDDPGYRHAGIDIYLDPNHHGQGLGTDALRTMVRHLIDDEHHHRIVIDPAADNAAAIASYRKVGFRPVGVMRQYERGADGTWHDGLLMELLASEFDG